MKSVLFFSVACLASILSAASGAEVLVTTLTTGGSLLSPGNPANVVSNTLINVPLDKSSLTPGQPIRITVSGSSEVLWVGGFVYGAGSLEISLKARLSAILGANTAFSEITFGQPEVVVTEGAGIGPMPETSAVVGFITGSILPEFHLDVPWETDLSAFQLNFAQDSTITGNQAGFTNSALSVAGIAVGASGFTGSVAPLRLTLSSIPEPSGVCLLLGAFSLGMRRKRAGAA